MSEKIDDVTAVGPHGVGSKIAVAGQMIDVRVQRLLQHRRQRIGLHPPTVRVGVDTV